MILIDTSFLILSLVPDSREGSRLRRWLAEGETLAISAIAWTEFLCGPVGQREAALAARIFGEPLPFGSQDAAAAADLFYRSGRRRGTLLDCMIAAAALGREARLATANPKDFRRLEPAGLNLVAK